jgi:iron complex outermembrane receptor protein
MDALFDRATRAGIRAEAASLPGGWQGAALHLYYTAVDHWMTDEYRTTAVGRPRPYSMATRAKTSVAGGRAEIQRGAFSLGFEGSRRNWNTNTMLAMQGYAPQNALPDVTSTLLGGFVSYWASPAPPWRLEAGARVDHAVMAAKPGPANMRLYTAYHGGADDRVTDLLPAGNLRVTFRAEHGWTATAGVGHAERLPDQQERFYALARAGSDWVGNPYLTPSKNTGTDGEWRWLRGGLDLALSGFVYVVNDDILVVEQPRSSGVAGVMNTTARSYANIDALVRGFEIRASVPLAARLSLAADGSLVRGTLRDDASTGEDMPEMPPPQAKVRLRYNDRRWSATMELVGSAAQKHVDAALRETPTAAFAVANVRMSARWRPLEISLAVDNAFDTRYAEHLSYQRDPFRSGFRVYEPGRTLFLSVSALF